MDKLFLGIYCNIENSNEAIEEFLEHAVSENGKLHKAMEYNYYEIIQSLKAEDYAAILFDTFDYNYLNELKDILGYSVPIFIFDRNFRSNVCNSQFELLQLITTDKCF